MGASLNCDPYNFALGHYFFFFCDIKLKLLTIYNLDANYFFIHLHSLWPISSNHPDQVMMHMFGYSSLCGFASTKDPIFKILKNIISCRNDGKAS